jgi:hypothetical protein
VNDGFEFLVALVVINWDRTIPSVRLFPRPNGFDDTYTREYIAAKIVCHAVAVRTVYRNYAAATATFTANEPRIVFLRFLIKQICCHPKK